MRLRKPRELYADKAYDTFIVRWYPQRKRIRAQIPKRGRKRHRGRPPTFDQTGYKKNRNSVERFFSWLKTGFRRLAVPYERLESTFLGFVHLACFVIHWRVLKWPLYRKRFGEVFCCKENLGTIFQSPKPFPGFSMLCGRCFPRILLCWITSHLTDSCAAETYPIRYKSHRARYLLVSSPFFLPLLDCGALCPASFSYAALLNSIFDVTNAHSSRYVCPFLSHAPRPAFAHEAKGTKPKTIVSQADISQRSPAECEQSH